MGSPVICPNCGAACLENASVCACGYRFSGVPSESPASPSDVKKPASDRAAIRYRKATGDPVSGESGLPELWVGAARESQTGGHGCVRTGPRVPDLFDPLHSADAHLGSDSLRRHRFRGHRVRLCGALRRLGSRDQSAHRDRTPPIYRRHHCRRRVSVQGGDKIVCPVVRLREVRNPGDEWVAVRDRAITDIGPTGRSCWVPRGSERADPAEHLC